MKKTLLLKFITSVEAFFCATYFILPIIFFNFIINIIFDRNVWSSFLILVLLFFIWRIFVKFLFVKISKKLKISLISIFFGTVVMALCPKLFIRDVQKILNHVNFYPLRNSYLREVARIKNTEVPRFIKFNLEAFEKTLLIFDESDELDEKYRIKSRDWWVRAKEEDAELASCAWDATKVAQHFYRVVFYCEYPYVGGAIPAS